MPEEIKALVRKSAFEINKDKSIDGYLVGLNMPGVDDSETAKKIGEELCRLGIMKSDWSIVGRNYIKGHVDRDMLAVAIAKGEL